MKRIFKIIFTIIISCMFMCSFNAANNTSLKDLKDALAKYKATYDSVVNKQNQLQQNIKNAENELAKISKEIDEYEASIKESKERVAELEKEIAEKQAEIDNLLSFLQVADEDNVYLEYIFNAKTYADFIYRSSVVEQLTKHNDDLITEMSNLIEENKQEQKRLEEKIDESEKAIDRLNETLRKYSLTMDDLVDDHKDAKADYEASKREVEAYEKLYQQNN